MKHVLRNPARWRGAAGLGLCVWLAGCSGDQADVIQVSGHIEATEVRISSKTTGRLSQLMIDEGDRVQSGQVLAQVDTTDLHISRRAADAERALAEAELRLRMAGARSEDIAAARAGMQQAETELAAAEKDLSRIRALLETGSATQKMEDDAQARRDVAQGRLDAAREQWQRLKRGSRPEEIDAAAARLDAADARVAQIRQQIADARIVAPSAGRVTEKLAEPGELLGVGSPVVILTNLDSPWLTVYLSEPDLGRVALGQDVDVTTDGGEERKGTLTYVSSEAEFTPRNVQTRDERVKLVFEARVGLENPDGIWKPGMPAEASLQTRRAQ
ncbi:MAG: efflux RND transporter periplasmic adaptor subunit [Candidatus Eisenbacteria bacterium]|uniref:Efflux RND transporter periplasmic adaptor subunit n=1 Tax=Eiseniibacteriota bacterium TaxID=2212470 RepID=A0A956LW87_UNCEI|nr:efflux RND transporter periplasmic adaptor subunit [Candidatus Eisenbacteria bacterium]